MINATILRSSPTLNAAVATLPTTTTEEDVVCNGVSTSHNLALLPTARLQYTCNNVVLGAAFV
jgi:hypothetical protein